MDAGSYSPCNCLWSGLQPVDNFWGEMIAIWTTKKDLELILELFLNISGSNCPSDPPPGCQPACDCCQVVLSTLLSSSSTRFSNKLRLSRLWRNNAVLFVADAPLLGVVAEALYNRNESERDHPRLAIFPSRRLTRTRRRRKFVISNERRCLSCSRVFPILQTRKRTFLLWFLQSLCLLYCHPVVN